MSRDGSRTPTLGHQVVAFFAANPEEELTTNDIAAKFAVGGQVGFRLESLVDAGWIGCDRGSPAGRVQNVFRAGPELLRAIGRAPA